MREQDVIFLLKGGLVVAVIAGIFLAGKYIVGFFKTKVPQAGAAVAGFGASLGAALVPGSTANPDALQGIEGTAEGVFDTVTGNSVSSTSANAAANQLSIGMATGGS